MASPISSSIGLGSGLDIGSIVKVLVESDTAAKQAQITRQTSNNSAMISGVGALRSALTAYQDALKKLNDKNAPSFNAYAATSANEGVVKVTSGNSAVAGSYSVQVEQLATGSKVASKAFQEGASKPVSEGVLTIQQGDSKSYTVNIGSGATLQSVRDQINKEMGANGISANIVNDKDGARLVLSSSVTGEGNDLILSKADSQGVVDEDFDIDGTKSMQATGAGYITGVAQDAKLTIDGLAVKSATNTLSDTVSGMTMELTGVSKALEPTTVTVAANNEGLKKSVQGFVDAFNTLQKAITSLTATSRDENDNLVLGSLTNDPTTRSLLADVRSVLSEVGSGDQLTSLSQLGINTQKDGTLEFNSVKFTAALNDKRLGAEIQELFTGSNGVFERMNKAIEPYNATDGSLATRKNNLDKIAKGLSDQQAALDRRTDSLTVSLTKKYVALDTALGKMKAQANQITSFFDAINAQAKNS